MAVWTPATAAVTLLQPSFCACEVVKLRVKLHMHAPACVANSAAVRLHLLSVCVLPLLQPPVCMCLGQQCTVREVAVR